MHAELNALAESLSKFRAFDAEKPDLDAAEIKAQADLKSAAGDGPITSAAVSRKVTAASTMLDTIAGRRAHLKSQAEGMLSELSQKLRAADAAWMAVIFERRAKIIDRWIAVNAEFYPDGAEAAAAAVKFVPLPGVDDIEPYTWKGSCQLTQETAVITIAHFFRHLKKHAADFNLTIAATSSDSNKS